MFFGPIINLAGTPRPCKIPTRPQSSAPIVAHPMSSEALNTVPQWRDCKTMPIARHDLEISQHDDVSILFDFLDPDGNPLDISGFTRIVWIVAESVAGAILITKTTDDGSILLPAATRASTVLTKAQTGSLTPTRIFPEPRISHKDKALYHELKGINSGGEQQTMLRGKFTVEDTRISD